MKIHKTAVDFAIKNRINLWRNHHGYYFISYPSTANYMSMHTTAQSAIAMMRKFIRRSA